jgi:hypothetical protein
MVIGTSPFSSMLIFIIVRKYKTGEVTYMVEYLTNPNKRCCFCKGREVITMEGHRTKKGTSSLKEIKEGIFACINEEECLRNIQAERTEVNFYTDDEGKIVKQEITYDGDLIFEAEK